MKINIARFNHFFYGFIPGLFIPVGFMWLYLNRFYPSNSGFIETIQHLYPGAIFSKLLMLSIIPNLILVFIIYKTDSFKLATGIMLGGIPYLLFSIFIS